MTTFAAERPTFFEGQYIGADDLDAIVDYLRVLTARQNLGQHTWGIAIGLDLVSEPVSDTAVEYYLQPGVAVDGYGRIIVVTTPTLISADQFVSIGSGNIDLWIRYEQSEFEAVRSGFQVCSAEDEYRRVNETFAIEVGSKTSILNRQSGVTVNDVLINDAREALVSVDPDAALLCDASIPHQQLPVDDETAFWLIPLGHVRWSAASTNFLPLVDAAEVEALDNGTSVKTRDQVYEAVMLSRSKRRLIGAVAESIYAADGLIRLRERTSAFDAAVENDIVCDQLKINSRDLSVCDGQLKPKELIWLEGNTRITGDTRLFNSRLEFKDAEGRDYIDRTVEGNLVTSISPMLLQRKDGNSKNGVDLQIVLGESVDGRNRLTIGQGKVVGDDLCKLSVDNSNKVIIQDNGRVGIGTVDPETSLLSPLTIRGLQETITENPGTADEVSYDVMRLLNLEGQGGALQWQMDLWDDLESLSFNETGSDNGRLFLQAGGNIGIGTTEPEAKLDITQVAVSNGGSALGNDLWLRLGNGGDDGRVWVEYGSQAAPLLVLSDDDDPPRIQFQQTDSTDPEDDFSPAYSSWFGHAQSDSSDLAIMGGQLGVGTDEPNAQLTVQANGGGARFYSGQNSGHFWLGFYTDGAPGSARAGWLGYGSNATSNFTIRNDKADGDIVLTPARNVGIGTTAPTEKLDVRGDIRLGNNGQYYAVTAEQRMHTVAGRITSAGGVAQGSGFGVNPPHIANSGSYTIRFTPAFAAAPIVVASAFNHSDNVVYVQSSSPNSCVIISHDVLGANAGPQDIDFSFIAVGER